MPVPTDELSERYLKKAIAEINELGHEIAQAAGADRAPVLGSGHPLADVFLLKHRPRDSEIQEGVAFYGRAGDAIMKALGRLRVDPTAIYGTNVLKYDGEEEEEARGWLVRELHVVQPKLIVVMGQDAPQVSERDRLSPVERARAENGRDPALHADDGRPGDARRGRLAGRAAGEAGLLGGLQGARALVGRAPALALFLALGTYDALAERLRSRHEWGHGRVLRARPDPGHLLDRVARAPARSSSRPTSWRSASGSSA